MSATMKRYERNEHYHKTMNMVILHLDEKYTNSLGIKIWIKQSPKYNHTMKYDLLISVK